MIHNLTKFQLEVWNKIKPHLKEEYGTQINFDDELQINFSFGNGKIVLDVFPHDEVLLFIHFENEGFEKHFFNSSNLDSLIEILKKNEYQ
jgi:hypothetical protein